MMLSRRAPAFSIVALVTAVGVNTASGAGRPTAPRAQASEPRSLAASSSQVAMTKYCAGCHNQKLQTAGLALDSMDLANVPAGAEVWERVLRKLRAGLMPPAGVPRPDESTVATVVAWLETELDRAALAKPDPGRTETFHRLNRSEYQNAIRDLLALEIDAGTLIPADDTGQHGFDNIGDVLSVSPALLNRYMLAARKVSRLAIGLAPNASTETYRTSHLLLQDERIGEDLPFGSRGGLAVRYNFPVDGEYFVKIRLQRNYSDYIRGIGEARRIDVRVDGTRVKRFTVGGDAPGQPAPASFGANVAGSPEWERYVLEADAGLEVRFGVRAGPRVVAVSFPRELTEPEGVVQPRQTGIGLTVNEMYHDNPAVESIEIGGPFRATGPGDTPSRRRVFVCQPVRAADEEPCARQILSALARRAYRRPVTDGDVEALLRFYRAGRAEGFEAGMQFALERVLTDPEFLFRIERDPLNVRPGTAYRLTDVELASRLSFFLWSGIPDDRLLDLAVRGRLKDPLTLEREVRRLFSDDRARALVDNFAGQWLELRNVGAITPDPVVFADFDENLRSAFQQESQLFLESQLREDRSVLELLTADYTFVNERLARHYGIPNIYGERFRRVTLSDERRRGILGQGGLLAVTSYPDRTSPVLRGKWLLQNLLGTPPPPPPPNVPALPARAQGGKPASVRERLEQHRANPVCATCHSQMDPLGFALEAFDAVGAWRTTSEAGTAIDASGVLPGGAAFDGPAGLRSLLLSRRDQFVATLAEKLLAYALGRPVDYRDMPVVRQVVRDAAKDGYRWSSIVLGIVRSVPFQMRRALAEGAGATGVVASAPR